MNFGQFIKGFTGTQLAQTTYDVIRGKKDIHSGSFSREFLDPGKVGGSWDQKPPVPPDATPAPTIDNAEIAAEQNSDMLRRRMGRASTILTGQNGAAISSQNVASKILLGM